MPLPLLFIGIVAATGLTGIGKGVKAAIDLNEAGKTNEEANNIITKANSKLDDARKFSKKTIDQLGKCKLDILTGCISEFVELFSQLRNVDFQQTVGINELNKFHIDKQELKELEEMGEFATSILGGITGGAIGGALTAFGAYSAASSFAAASTGTAIATLSGIAAQNATLAFFGGGSLAAGGLGVAGGTMVLGGLVAGPALAIMGFIAGAKANTEKNKAYKNLALAKKHEAEINVASEMCNAISKRCDMFREVLGRLKKYMVDLNSKMNDAINKHGTNYQSFSKEDRENVAAAVAVVKAIKALLDTPILTEHGELTSASERMLNVIKNSGLYNGDFLATDY